MINPLERIYYALLNRLNERLGKRRGQSYFEYLYSKKEDVWDYRSSEYELTKYDESIKALPRSQYNSVLEVGCSIGVFTEKISLHSDSVLAIDISEIAIRRAKKAADENEKIEFRACGLESINEDRKFDLICVAEVLYYMADSQQLIIETAEKISDLLEVGGNILYVSGGSTTDKYNNWEKYFIEYGDGLKLNSTQWYEHSLRDYRISIFEKS